MADSTKVIGRMVSDMGKDLKGFQTETAIMVILNSVKLMEKEFIPGIMVKSMMVNGLLVLNKGMEFGEGLEMINILVNGFSQKLMDTEFIFGQMETDLKEFGIWD